ncbi:MAG: hypothetical protein U9N87_06210 [Planctomycetota bacterium]|nr:hypothetical protein [Planctomycetota bacterium]
MATRLLMFLLIGLTGLISSGRAAETAAKSPSKSPAKPAASVKKSAQQFLRLSKDDRGKPLALEVAIVRFVADASKNAAKPAIVDLVGAVHIGEPEYYDRLNDEFEKYDAVLFEMVAPKGDAVPRNGKGKSDHPVAAMQNMMTRMLELEFQLDGVDYGRDNFVHADMSPAEFSKSMQDRKESFFGMFLRSLGYAMTQPGSSSGAGDAQLLMALFDKNRALALKRVMAGQFQDMGGVLAVLDGPNGSTLITERNKVALAVLKSRLDAGAKKVAVFYGAGHMADMAKRLEDDFDMRRTHTRWLKAWDLRGEKSKSDKAGKDNKSAGAKIDQ